MVENEKSLGSEQKGKGLRNLTETVAVNQRLALMTDRRVDELTKYTYTMACSPDVFIRQVQSETLSVFSFSLRGIP